MLTVVEHQEQLLHAQELREALLDGLTLARHDAERGGDHFHHRGGITDRRELTEPRPVPILGQHTGSNLERDTRLAHPTDTRQRHHAGLAERGWRLR